MPKIITSSAGEVMLNDTLMPGVYQSMEVTGKLKFDEKDVPGSSGKRKQPLGYEDAEITLTLRLLTDDNRDCYEKVETLAGLFYNVDSTAKPYVYRIVNKLLDSWKIKEILFAGLRTNDDNKTNTIMAYLDFTEYKPTVVAAEAKAATPAITTTSTLTAANTTVSQGVGDLRQAEREYVESNSDYSDAGLRVSKLVQSPAVDDDLA